MRSTCGKAYPITLFGVTLGSDFRLPKDALPRRYGLGFDLDLEAWTFRGSERIEMDLRRPRRELYLHAVDLEVSRAVARGAGREVAPGLQWDKEAEVVILRFPEELPGGAWTLELEFKGPIRPDLKAIYRSTRGEERYAVTQLAPADARRAFPCFDEPEFKARFALELTAPAGLQAVANMRPLARRELGGGRTRWRFAETPPLSCYLLAFAVGPFEGTAVVRTNTGIPVRVWLPAGLAADGVYARDAHREAIEWLESYTGIPYPYDKVEGLGIPDFSAGAMENPGAVTYRLHVLAANPAKASTAVLKQTHEYVAHELTHMWWGDLATLAWWDDIWLNEAFATFVGHKANAALRPRWRFWRDFLHRARSAFSLDALASTHPISMPARSAEQAWQRFDAISYEKGASVLRMLEAYLGEETFRRGVRLYLERFREANATAADFWGALDEASGADATRLASAWITESGHPLVDLRLASEGRLGLRQRRFFADPQAPDTGQRWPIPLVLRTGAGEVRSLFDSAEGAVDVAPGTWAFPNSRATGFYRYALDRSLRDRLLPHVPELDAEERLGLIDNDWALLRAGVIRADDYVAVVRALEREDDRVVLTTLHEQLRWLGEHAVGDAQREAFETLVTRLFGPHLERLGWEGKLGDEEDDEQLRPIAIRALGQLARLREVRDAAARRVRAHLDGRTQDRNVVGALAIVAAIDGDEALQARYLQRMREVELSDPQEESRFRGALASFERPAAAARTIAASFDGTIRDQDFRFTLAEGLRTTATRLDYWRAIRERWDEKIAPLETSLRNAIVVALSQLSLPAVMPAVREFLLAKRREDSAEVTAQALEGMRLDAAAAERIGRELASALEPEGSLPR